MSFLIILPTAVKVLNSSVVLILCFYRELEENKLKKHQHKS